MTSGNSLGLLANLEDSCETPWAWILSETPGDSCETPQDSIGLLETSVDSS